MVVICHAVEILRKFAAMHGEILCTDLNLVMSKTILEIKCSTTY